MWVTLWVISAGQPTRGSRMTGYRYPQRCVERAENCVEPALTEAQSVDTLCAASDRPPGSRFVHSHCPQVMHMLQRLLAAPIRGSCTDLHRIHRCYYYYERLMKIRVRPDRMGKAHSSDGQG